MWRIIKFLILLPVIIVIVGVSMANRTLVSLYLIPQEIYASEPLVHVPLYLIMLGCVVIGILLGGISSWLAHSKTREQKRVFKRELDKLKKSLASEKKA